MIFADIELSKRLERAEGFAAARFAQARRHVQPASRAEWTELAGACAIFDGPESPVTQTFGLGLFEELTVAGLDSIERFFRERNAPVMHEVSPFAGVAALELLCERGYRPMEVSNVLFRPVEVPAKALLPGITVRSIEPGEAAVWCEVSAQGWSHEHPELREFMHELGSVITAREHSPCFLAEWDGVPGAAGVLCLHQGVALFGGAATVPAFRRRGLQAALLQERMRYAAEQGCDVAEMVAIPGSNSQRNAERQGFRTAYTRTKWRLQI